MNRELIVARLIFFAHVVVVLGLSLLVLAWVYVLLHDVFQLVPRLPIIIPAYWPQMAFSQMFGEAFFIEQLQFKILMGATSVGLIIVVYALTEEDRSFAVTATLLTIGLALMYFNDAHNARHQVAWFLSELVYGKDFSPRNIVRQATELIIYIFLGAVMVLAFFRLWSCRSCIPRFQFLLIAYAAYFVASVASVTRFYFGWYDKVGRHLAAWFPDHFIDELRKLEAAISGYPYYFWIMDWAVEESIELIGATFFLAAMLMMLAWRVRVAGETEQNKQSIGSG